MAQGVSSTRLHYLDHMRGALMALGVVLHSANVFRVDGGWVVWDSVNTSTWLTYIANAIHAFRVPAFFVVSGLLLARSSRSRASSAVLLARLRRIGVPLVVTMFTLNTAERFLIYRSTELRVPFWEYMAGELASNRWLGHLWFLLILLGCTIAATVTSNALRRLARLLPASSGTWIPLTAPLLIICIHSIARLAPIMHSQVMGFTGVLWLDTLSYFVCGYMLGENENVLGAFTRCGSVAVALHPCSWLSWPVPIASRNSNTGSAIAWSGIAVTFVVFANLFNRTVEHKARVLLDSHTRSI